MLESPRIFACTFDRIFNTFLTVKAPLKRTSKLLVAAIVLAFIILAAAFALTRGAPGFGDAKPRYRTAQVDRGAIVQRITANGTLNPVVVVKVGTQVSGTVMKLYTDFNKPVKAGQVLLELDPSLFEASVAQSRANLAASEAQRTLAQSNYDRNKRLVDAGFISVTALDQFQSQLAIANASLAQVRASLRRDETNLKYSVIRAPIDGIVIDRQIDIGQTVAASFQTPTLFSIARDLDAMQIDTSVAEADIGGIRDGQPVRFTVDAFPDREFVGRVRTVRLNPTTQQNVVSYNVVVDVTNDQGILKPGMTAQVSLTIAEKPDVVRIPSAALRFRPTKDERDDVPSTAKPDPSVTPRDADAKDPGRPRRSAAKAYRVGAKNALIAVELRTGIAGGPYTELVSGEVKPGDALVVRDLQADKAQLK